MNNNTSDIRSNSGVIYNIEQTIEHCGWGFKLYDKTNIRDKAIERAGLLNRAIEEYTNDQQTQNEGNPTFTDAEIANAAYERVARLLTEEPEQYYTSSSNDEMKNKSALYQYVGNHMRLVDVEQQYIEALISEVECEERIEDAIDEVHDKALLKGYRAGLKDEDIDELL